MPRGGYRKGRPGTAYASRTDLNKQPVRTGPSQGYGERVAQERAQQAIPLPASSPATAIASLGAGRPAPVPGQLGALDRPSARPGEPVTAGAPIGPGPGPDPTLPAFNPVVETLRAAYQAFPNEAIAAVLERAEAMEQ